MNRADGPPRPKVDSPEIRGKSIFDRAFAAIALVLFAPALAAIGAVIWLRSGGPVFIRQERVGKLSKRFLLVKFRTLPVVCLRQGDKQWKPPRADAWGEFLRRTGLDELPQLINVLRGEMSLVGPRPERPYFVEKFERRYHGYGERHRVRVGITGLAQVHGWRGDTSIRIRLDHDLYYVTHSSWRLDLRILWLTLRHLGRELFTSPRRKQDTSVKEAPRARFV